MRGLQGQPQINFLAVILLCLLLSLAGSSIAAQTGGGNRQPQDPPGFLQQMGKALLEGKSPSQQKELEQFAQRHQGDVRGVLAHLVLGYHAYQEEQYARSQQHFQAARRPQSPLQDYGEYYLALSELAEEDHAAVAELLDGFAARYPSSPLAGPATLKWAESLLQLDRPAEAIARLSLPSLSLPQPEANALLAEAYGKDNQPKRAARFYQNIYYLFPNSEQAAEADRQLRKLRSRLGKAFPAPSLKMREARAERLFAAGRWRSARREYQTLASRSSGVARERYRLRMGVSQYRGRATWPALSTLGKLKVSEPEMDAERLYTLAALYRRLRREKNILQQIELLSKKYPQSPWREASLYLAGNYYLLLPDLDRADRYYTMVYRKFPQGKYAARSHWRVVWRSYRERRLPEAQRLLEEHVRKYSSSPQAPAALYWLGRLLEPQSPAKAAVYYQKVGEAFPNYYYGQLARERLAALPAAAKDAQPANPALPGNRRVAASKPPEDRNPPRSAQPYWEKAKLLESAWLMDLAAEELGWALKKNPSSRFLGRELARLEAERGRHHVALRHAKRIFRGYLSYAVSALPRDEWELLFPLPWWEQVKKRAEEAKLDPFLVAGLIRQESEFDPKARSRANARGLMQLMPSTARRVARGLRDRRDRRYRLASLYLPEYNLAYGTHYLRKVLDLFQGRLELALAAYNAGENRVEEWLRDVGYDDPAEFVETIPFTETRNYVQGVLRNAALYRQLYPAPD